VIGHLSIACPVRTNNAPANYTKADGVAASPGGMALGARNGDFLGPRPKKSPLDPG